VPNDPAPTTDARTAARYPSGPPLSCAEMRAPRTKWIAHVAALSAAALVIGCGGDDDVNNNADDYSGTEAEVATLVDDFANAGRDGDGTQICEEIFAPELAENIQDEAAQSCPSEVQDNLPEDDYELEIDSLDLEDDKATVAVTDQDDNSSVLHIERADAGWHITRVTPAD